MDSIKLGDKVKDTVTGYRGTVTGLAQWSFQPDSAYVESLHDGQCVEGWLRVARLELADADED